jgi:hypothetical protein
MVNRCRNSAPSRLSSQRVTAPDATDRQSARRADSACGRGVTRISVIRSMDRVEARCIPLLTWEPVSRFEPPTCRLQEVRPPAPRALAARMARVIALTAPPALGLSGASFREPFHADGGQRSMAVTERSDQNPPQRHRDLTAWSDRTSDLPDLPLHCQIGPHLDRGGAAARHSVRRARAVPALARRSDRLTRDAHCYAAWDPLHGFSIGPSECPAGCGCPRHGS